MTDEKEGWGRVRGGYFVFIRVLKAKDRQNFLIRR